MLAFFLRFAAALLVLCVPSERRFCVCSACVHSAFCLWSACAVLVLCLCSARALPGALCSSSARALPALCPLSSCVLSVLHSWGLGLGRRGSFLPPARADVFA
eukprot:15091283-Alexandrium_andersonii.AAC.1